MESSAVVQTMEAVNASTSALAVLVGRAAGSADPAGGPVPAGSAVPGPDPLQDQADAYLDGLAELAKAEARLAALKVQLVAGYTGIDKALTPPAASLQDRTVRDMAVTAEVAGVLTISERAASGLRFEAMTLTTGLPLTLSALQVGGIAGDSALDERPARCSGAGLHHRT